MVKKCKTIYSIVIPKIATRVFVYNKLLHFVCDFFYTSSFLFSLVENDNRFRHRAKQFFCGLKATRIITLMRQVFTRRNCYSIIVCPMQCKLSPECPCVRASVRPCDQLFLNYLPSTFPFPFPLPFPFSFSTHSRFSPSPFFPFSFRFFLPQSQSKLKHPYFKDIEQTS